MSNAPMYSVAGGTTRPADNGKVTTLAEIDQTKIFQTELEARQNLLSRCMWSVPLPK